MSEKEKTNKKWTSSDKYRNNHDAIFGKHSEFGTKLINRVKTVRDFFANEEEQSFIDSHTEDKLVRLLVKAGLTEPDAKVAADQVQNDAMQSLVDLSEQWGLYDREAAEHLKDIRSERLSDVLNAPLDGYGPDEHVMHSEEYKRMALNVGLAARHDGSLDKPKRKSAKKIK